MNALADSGRADRVEQLCLQLALSPNSSSADDHLRS